MKKQTAKVAAKPATDAPQVKAVVITVVPNAKAVFRVGSARELYWQAVKAHDGKSLAELATHVAANPPSQPKKGKLAGQTEPLSGWVRWFTRHGFITLA